MQPDVVIVGAGFFGATLAERLANDAKKKVLVLDRRDHIGGNSYSAPDKDTGIEVHRYGSHIFHTKSRLVWDYVNRFSNFNHYKHRVFSKVSKKLYHFPANLATLTEIYPEVDFSPEKSSRLLARFKAEAENPRNLLEKGRSLVGKKLFDILYYGYTSKQWGQSLETLPASIINRIPVKTDLSVDYFDDPYQGIPVEGYGALFRKMLASPKIHVRTGTSLDDYRRESGSSDYAVVYTGPMDDYYGYRFGRLTWRSLRFEVERYDIADYQGTSVINHPDAAVPYTRTHEFKHFCPENHSDLKKTVIYREYSIPAETAADCYYPVRAKNDLAIYEKYKALAIEKSRMDGMFFFGGRLAEYKYYDMDATIASALSLYAKIRDRIKGSE